MYDVYVAAECSVQDWWTQRGDFSHVTHEVSHVTHANANASCPRYARGICHFACASCHLAWMQRWILRKSKRQLWWPVTSYERLMSHTWMSHVTDRMCIAHANTTLNIKGLNKATQSPGPSYVWVRSHLWIRVIWRIRCVFYRWMQRWKLRVSMRQLQSRSPRPPTAPPRLPSAGLSLALTRTYSLALSLSLFLYFTLDLSLPLFLSQPCACPLQVSLSRIHTSVFSLSFALSLSLSLAESRALFSPVSRIASFLFLCLLYCLPSLSLTVPRALFRAVALYICLAFSLLLSLCFASATSSNHDHSPPILSTPRTPHSPLLASSDGLPVAVSVTVGSVSLPPHLPAEWPRAHPVKSRHPWINRWLTSWARTLTHTLSLSLLPPLWY